MPTPPDNIAPHSQFFQTDTRSQESFRKRLTAYAIDKINQSSKNFSDLLDITNQTNEAFWTRLGVSKKWSFFPAVIAFSVTGLITIPNFSTGILWGMMEFSLSIMIRALMVCAIRLTNEPNFSIRNSSYVKAIGLNLLHAALLGPIIEELVFRGALQPISTEVIAWCFPSTSTEYFECHGCNFSIATAISILTTSLVFGAAHLSNQHAESRYQAISACIAGIILGDVAAQYGLGASIATHSTCNTIATTINKLIGLFDEDTPKEEIKTQDFSSLACNP